MVIKRLENKHQELTCLKHHGDKFSMLSENRNILFKMEMASGFELCGGFLLFWGFFDKFCEIVSVNVGEMQYWPNNNYKHVKG